MKVLIIDDEVEITSLLAQAMKLDGHEPIVAHDGPKGLALINEQRPDVVFLDVRMPEMDGIEVLRRIRANNPALPVVLITGQAVSRELEEARRLGVTEIVEKPSFLMHLRETLARLQTQKILGRLA